MVRVLMTLNRTLLRTVSYSLFLGVAATAFASPEGAKVWTPDNGDGTFKNPILWGDWPDPDVIRVGDDFYLSSTSMHSVPGCPVLKSKDLVNWEMGGYAVSRYDEDPRYDMKGGTVYSHGSWASTIRHHNGLFYVGFCTPYGVKGGDGNFSMCTAKDIRGPWTRTIFPEYLYDPGLMFDDDGKVYVAHGQGTLYVTELNADALSVKTPKKVVFPNRRDYPYLEGSHLYKINGRYYILCTTGGDSGRQICLRSDNIYGPYEDKVVLNDTKTLAPAGFHQGGMVQTKDGAWWFVIMLGRGATGRTAHLEPVTWVDGWPMLGKDGKAVLNFPKPKVDGTHPIRVPATSDEFDAPTLGLQWQWNHNPDDSKWSLTERPGHLRLKAASVTTDLSKARNTLTQRIQGPDSQAEVSMDVRGMKDGDVAGFGLFQIPYSYVAVVQEKGVRRIRVVVESKTLAEGEPLSGDKVFIRLKTTSKDDTGAMAYGTDGKTYRTVAEGVKLGQTLNWTPCRFALFNYSTSESGLGGYVDFDEFRFSGE